MANRFHLAIPVGDITTALNFYCNVLGCEKGNSEFKYPDAWVDINFWGNELTLHSSEEFEKIESKRHNVDMGNVTVPHFGVHISAEDFANLKERLAKHKTFKRFLLLLFLYLIQMVAKKKVFSST